MDTTAYFDAIRDGDVETLRRVVAERPELLEDRTAPGIPRSATWSAPGCTPPSMPESRRRRAF